MTFPPSLPPKDPAMTPDAHLSPTFTQREHLVLTQLLANAVASAADWDIPAGYHGGMGPDLCEGCTALRKLGAFQGEDALLPSEEAELDPEDSDGRWCANCLAFAGEMLGAVPVTYRGPVTAVIALDANSGRWLCQACEPHPAPVA